MTENDQPNTRDKRQNYLLALRLRIGPGVPWSGAATDGRDLEAERNWVVMVRVRIVCTRREDKELYHCK